MSPVCSTVPAPVWIAIARQPGIEWLTWKYSHSNTPCVLRFPLRDFDENRFDAVFTALLRDQRKRELRSDQRNIGRSLSRNGMAPMWSSCAWVSTSASTSSRRSSTRRRSGRIRSTPGSSCPGKSTPQSTISRRPRCSKTVMLRPISLMPPNAVTRKPPGASGPGGLRSVSTIEVPSRRAYRRPAPRSGPWLPAPEAAADHRRRCPAAVAPPWTSSHRRAATVRDPTARASR